jgi:hypothetical protein
MIQTSDRERIKCLFVFCTVSHLDWEFFAKFINFYREYNIYRLNRRLIKDLKSSQRLGFGNKEAERLGILKKKKQIFLGYKALML